MRAMQETEHVVSSSVADLGHVLRKEHGMEQLGIEDLQVRMFVARQIELPPNTWTFANVQDSFWRLYMNNRDGAVLELPDGRYALAADQLYFVPAGVRFSCTNTAAVGHFYIHF